MNTQKITIKTPIPVKTPTEMIEILSGDQIAVAKRFVELGAKLGCKSKVNATRLQKTWKCVYSRTKPTRVLYTLTCTANEFNVKACLWNIDAYPELLSSCSDKIKSIVVNAYDCKACSGDRCKGGAAFTYENQLYRKCVGCCFYFSDLSNDEWNDLLMLIEKEYDATSSK